MRIVKTWVTCPGCLRPVYDREKAWKKHDVFVVVKTTNVILTAPYDGHQVETGDEHDCRNPQPYEVVVPVHLRLG